MSVGVMKVCLDSSLSRSSTLGCHNFNFRDSWSHVLQNTVVLYNQSRVLCVYTFLSPYWFIQVDKEIDKYTRMDTTLTEKPKTRKVSVLTQKIEVVLPVYTNWRSGVVSKDFLNYTILSGSEGTFPVET
jgi:hypothetical protein